LFEAIIAELARFLEDFLLLFVSVLFHVFLENLHFSSEGRS
jgi:hypothetical protein